MRRALLVEPWITDFAAFDLWRKPLGLLYIGAMLEGAGVEVAFESALEDVGRERKERGWHRRRRRRFGTGKLAWQEIAKPAALSFVPRRYKRYGVTPSALAERLGQLARPDVVMVTSMMTYWYPGVEETVRVVREVFRDVPVVLGGVYATLCPGHAGALHGVDEVAAGGAHEVLPRVSQRYLGTAVDVPPACSEWPTPAYHLFPDIRSINVLSSWGCHFRCDYCASWRLSGGFIEREASIVVEEIAHLLSVTGVGDVAFFDDAFLVNSSTRAKPLLRMLAERFPGVRFHLPNGLHARHVDVEVAELLAAANVKTVRLALEGLSPNVTRLSRSKTSGGHVAAALECLDRAGFDRAECDVYVLAGLPGQTEEAIRMGIELVHSLGACVHVNEFSPIPQTAIWQTLGGKADAIEREPLLANNKALFCWDVPHRFAAMSGLKELAHSLNAASRQSAASGSPEILQLYGDGAPPGRYEQ